MRSQKNLCAYEISSFTKLPVTQCSYIDTGTEHFCYSLEHFIAYFVLFLYCADLEQEGGVMKNF